MVDKSHLNGPLLIEAVGRPIRGGWGTLRVGVGEYSNAVAAA